MALNFNVSPYYDDFDPTKNFHRILFKPGFAVQARELTQSQTILQNQISNFAQNIFSTNTPISGGKVTTNLNCYYIRLNSTYSGASITAANFLNKVIQDSTGVILAKVIATTEATGTAGAGDPPTLIVSYISGGAKFTDGMLIVPSDGTNIAATVSTTTISQSSTGYSSVASVSSGVYYVVNGYSQSSTPNADGSYTNFSIGNFVQVNPQTTILSKYSNTPSVRVGLQITETIVDYIDDSSLLDPAVGASNYQAPGADRYQINLTLSTLPLTLGNDNNFIELVRVVNGQIVYQVSGTSYSAIDDYFAKRDFETNGDYVVNDFSLTPASNAGGNSSMYDLSIGPGVAYVHGYRIENQSKTTLTSDRARTPSVVNPNYVYIDYGSYLYTDTANGFFDVTTQPTVDLHCVTAANVLSDISGGGKYNSTLIGQAAIRNFIYNSGTGAANTWVFKTYLSDINMFSLANTAGASSTANSIVLVDSGQVFSTIANAYYGMALTAKSGTILDQRTISSYTVSGTTKTFFVNPPFTITPTTSTTFTLNPDPTVIESVLRNTGSNTAATIVASTNVNNAYGKVNGLATGATILQNPSSPEMLFTVGNPYVANLFSTNYTTTQAWRNVSFNSSTGLSLTVTTGSPLKFIGSGSLSGTSVLQNYLVVNPTTGAVLDFSAGSNTVTVTNNQQTVAFASPTYATQTVDVITLMNVTSGDGTSFILKIKNLVTGNTNVFSSFATAVTGTTGCFWDSTMGQTKISYANATGNNKISFYVCDVKKVKKIVDTLIPGASLTAGMLTSSQYDVTDQYVYNNGQQDSHYDYGYITPIAGSNGPRGDIVVFYDYYTHAGGDGYFSVLSYLSATYGGVSSSPELYQNIGSYTSKAGNVYRLTDVIDFRPTRNNGTTTLSYQNSSGGIYLPNDLTQFVGGYSFYMGRKDKLILSKDKNFQIIEGTSSLKPLPPAEPDGSLVLANLTLDPYTAYVPGENPPGIPSNLSIVKVPHNRWAKSDITNLQTRVNNLEYYASLSQLETSAIASQVSDTNGVVRPNYGILVDSFTSYTTADTANPDYMANISVRNGQLTPLSIVDNFQLQNPYVVASIGTLSGTSTFAINSIGSASTNLFTLPYTTANVATQPLASSAISLNPFAVVVYQGNARLSPPMDNWVDNTKSPSILITDPNIQVFQQDNGVNLTNSSDFAVIPGTSSTTTSTTNTVGHNINPSPFGYQGYTATTTTTYASQLENVTTSTGYSPVSSSLNLNNNYLKNISILPYIRSQQLGFNVTGLLPNSPVTVTFDGTDVNSYLISPDTIELVNVSGTFSEGDVVGFYNNNQFSPTARVLGTHTYGTSNNMVRLYVSSVVGAPVYSQTSTMQNGQYDANGNYIGTTANGTVNSGITPINTAGSVTAVGNTYSTTGGSGYRVYKVRDPNRWGTFLNSHGIWGDLKQTSTYSATFYWIPSYTGTYTFVVSNTGTGTNHTTVSVNGSTVFTTSGVIHKTGATFTYSFVAGTQYTISWSVTGSPSGYASGHALVIYDLNGEVAFTSLNPPGTTKSDGSYEIAMYKGGAYFTGVSKIALDQKASAITNYYVGAKISVTSTFVTQQKITTATVVPRSTTDLGTPINSASGGLSAYSGLAGTGGKISFITGSYTYTKYTTTIVAIPSQFTYTANVTAYDSVNNIATLDSPVCISLGHNSSLGDVSSQYNLTGTITTVAGAISQGTGLPGISTDEGGNLVGIFSIPPNTFQTGERIFRVDNRTVATDPATATCYAQSTFTASGLATTSQSLEFAPSIDSAATKFTSVAQSPVQKISTITTYTPWDPIAQSFIIDKLNYPNGVFLNSIKVFFATKPTSNYPVTLFITNTQNGIPSGSALSYSSVTLNTSQITTSSTPHYLDPTTWTEFKFSAPVYVQSGVLYAFVLKASSPEYTVYYGQQNSIAVPSTAKAYPTDANPSSPTKIGAAPYVGALFESQNSITWTADQTSDLMFVMDKCVFNTSVAPSIVFGIPQGLPYRKIIQHHAIQQGLDANCATNLYGNYNTTMPSDAYNITTTDFVPSQTGISYQYSSILANGNIPVGPYNVTPGKYGSPNPGNILLNDGLGERSLISTIPNSFAMTATLSSTDPNVSPIISDDGITLYNIRNVVNNMGISNSVISVANTGSGYNANNISVTISSPDIGSSGAVLAANVANGAIIGVYVVSPGAGYITTPTITITDAATRQSGNANAIVTVIGETSQHGGNGLARYVTKKVVMPVGNDSGDLRVYYAAYKPPGTSVYVYYKIISSSDTDLFDNQSWQLMTQVTNQNVFSTSPTNIIEYECAPGVFLNGVANNNIAYTNTAGVTYNNFIQFAVKLVLATNDNTNPPIVENLRAIALPPGTGI